MLPVQLVHRSARFLGTALLGAVLIGSVAQPGRAADLDKIDSALKEMPADAAYFGTLLRNKEQFDVVAKSKAWAKLSSMPFVQQAWQMIQLQMAQNPEFQKLLKDPDTKDGLALLGDMWSHEVYLYCGGNSVAFVDVASQFISAARYGPLLAQLQGKPVDQEQAAARALLQALLKNADQLKSPDIVIGFKLTKTELAAASLKKMEAEYKDADKYPMLKGRIKREKVAGGDFVTIGLDGTMVPWKDVLEPLKKVEEKPGQVEGLIKKLTALKMTAAIGIRNGYLIYAVSESTAALVQFGKGKKLIDQPEFKALAKFGDRKLTSISYLSKPLNVQLSPSKKDIDSYAEMAEGWLKTANLTDDQKKRLRADLAEAAKDLKANIPEPGAKLSFSFMNARGLESYDYDWSEHPFADGSRPLPLLQHLGGSPIVATVGRAKFQPDAYPKLVKWVKIAYGYVDDFVVPNLDATQKEQLQKFTKVAGPLLKRLDDTTGKLLVPALADGQSGFVLDGKLSSKQWFVGMPASDKPLPMLEPALLIGVSDAGKLEKAFGEYRSLANDILTELRKVDKEFPDFKIPPPQARKLKSGTMYFYPLTEIGLEKRLLPNVGLAGNVAVLTVSQEHTERLLTPTPLKIDGGPLADQKKPLAAATYLDWPALLDTVSPWIEFGAKTYAAQAGGQDGDKQADEMLKQVRIALDVLRCFRSYTSATYVEDKALVTHGESVYRDLP
ncbi:MAG: hypothetical protein K2R98_29825 [Gemmataceae bacterium]|nr:hypothetical protein [Gemmataceae bacterium]